jgi:hypothetical protein
MNEKNAFVIIHFGNNIKYLELELYFIINLKKFTKYEILYMYSINDTPIEYIKIIEKLNILCIKYDDANITYNIKNFSSQYARFNTLRTCNFIFAYNLIKYNKICIIECDMIITKNIDNIFDLNFPSILYYNEDMTKHDENYLLEKKTKKSILDLCTNKSEYNGGVLLIKPSIQMFNLYKKNIKMIINNNCIFPNETLFIYTNSKKIYNLPIMYNKSKYYLKRYSKYNSIFINYIYHFNSEYKHLDLIKDNYLDNVDDFQKNLLLYFKKNIYDINFKKVNKLLNSI